MPIYDYVCNTCGEFEVIHKMDEVLEACEKCGSKDIEKKISPPKGLIFKGSGFYATDYKGGKDGKSDESSSFPAGGKSGTNYHDKQDKAPTGSDYQMGYKIK